MNRDPNLCEPINLSVQTNRYIQEPMQSLSALGQLIEVPLLQSLGERIEQ